MTLQTLAQGRTVASKYGKLGGFQNKRMVTLPSSLFGAVVGFSNAGKSNLIQSHNDGFIFNFGLSTTTHHPVANAMIWPGVDADGRPVEQCEEGEGYEDKTLGRVRPLELTWEAAKAKKALLIEMAKNNEPRPATIFIDTVFDCIKIVMPWIASHAAELGIYGSNVDDFKKLYGESSYDRLYDEIVNFALDLRNYGYGVYLVIHLAEKMVKRRGSTEREKDIAFTITDNFWLRLFPMFDIVMEVATEQRTRDITLPDKQLPGGKTLPGGKSVEKYKARVLIVDSPDPEMAKIVKQRVVMPGKFDLPAQNGWQAFSEFYMKHAALTGA